MTESNLIKDIPNCDQHEQSVTLDGVKAIKPAHIEQVAQMLKAMADTKRLELLLLLQDSGEVCVSEIVTATDEKMTTISNRLKQLYDAGLVNKQRDGQHILYSLQDDHVASLLDTLLAHAKHIH